MKKISLFHLAIIVACTFCSASQSSKMTGSPGDEATNNSRTSNFSVPQARSQVNVNELQETILKNHNVISQKLYIIQQNPDKVEENARMSLEIQNMLQANEVMLQMLPSITINEPEAIKNPSFIPSSMLLQQGDLHNMNRQENVGGSTLQLSSGTHCIVAPQEKLDFASLKKEPHIRVSYYFDEAADPLTFLYLNQKQKLTWDEFNRDILNKLVAHFQANNFARGLPFNKQARDSFENLLICNTKIGNLPSEVSQLIERDFSLYSLLPTTIDELRMICYEYGVCEASYLSGQFKLRCGKNEVPLDVIKQPKNR
jgi:hypothetical protein